MKATGLVRRIDDLGRIVIPMELRRQMDLNDKDSLEIFVEKEMIILKKYVPCDIFTGSMDNLVEYKGKKISKDTIKELSELL